jgi:hypothetical protein
MPTRNDARKALAGLLKACRSAPKEEFSSDAMQKLRIVAAAARYANHHLKLVETSAVLPERFAEIITAVKASETAVQRRFERGYYADQLGEPTGFLNTILLLPLKRESLQGAISSDIILELQASADQELGQISSLRMEAEKSLETQRVDAARVGEIVASMEQRAKAIEQTAQAADKRREKALDDQLKRQSTEHSRLLEDGRKRQDEEIRKSREDAEANLALLREEWKTASSKSQVEAEAALEMVQQHLRRTEEIVGVVSNTALAGSYAKVADQEHSDANRWRWISVGAMVGIIACALFALIHSLSEGFSVSAFTAKVITSFAFGILAAYAGRESGRHRRREQEARRMQLELATIDAYLLPLPEKQRHAIKAAVADRIFGQRAPEKEKDKESEAGSGLPPILDYLKLVVPDAK